MKLNIKKFADLTGVSVRTLHYYDEIGLLKPDEVDAQNGYRFYGDAAFARMQEVLFYRELDFSLADISDMLSSPNYNKQEALRGQKELLRLKKERLERIIAAIECTEKGETIMDMQAFDHKEFERAKETYQAEAKQRWGDTAAYAEHRQKTAGYTKQKWNELSKGINTIIAEFAAAKQLGVQPADDATMALTEKLKDFITETQYTCTNEILIGLGEMYVADNRFTKNIDRAGEGTAAYMREAIKAYCSTKS